MSPYSTISSSPLFFVPTFASLFLSPILSLSSLSFSLSLSLSSSFPTTLSYCPLSPPPPRHRATTHHTAPPAPHVSTDVPVPVGHGVSRGGMAGRRRICRSSEHSSSALARGVPHSGCRRAAATLPADLESSLAEQFSHTSCHDITSIRRTY